MLCQSCDCVYINGIKCHEHGCPDVWKDKQVECVWCGSRFVPEYKEQRYCSDSCYCIDNGLSDPNGEEEEGD